MSPINTVHQDIERARGDLLAQLQRQRSRHEPAFLTPEQFVQWRERLTVLRIPLRFSAEVPGVLSSSEPFFLIIFDLGHSRWFMNFDRVRVDEGELSSEMYELSVISLPVRP